MERDKKKVARDRKRKNRSFFKELKADMNQVLQERKQHLEIIDSHITLDDSECSVEHTDRQDSDDDIAAYFEDENYSEKDNNREIDRPGNVNIDCSSGPSTELNPTEISELRQWAIKSNISHTHLSDLLVILNKRLLPQLPDTAKTFLHTAEALYDVQEMEDALRSEPGQFVYFGIAQGLEKCLAPFHEGDVELIMNVDGLPLSKSGKSHFWPILCKVFYDPDIYQPFAVAIYSGSSKPKNVDDYFADFIQELNYLQEEGFVMEGKKFNVHLKAIVADTPARSMCKGTKGHGGYCACERCGIRGIGLKKTINKCTTNGKKIVYSTKIVYPGVGYPKRTNSSFRERLDPEHHTGISPLEDVSPELNMVQIFPLDFMHLVCVGAMKKLLELILSGPLKVRLSSRSRYELSRRLNRLKSQTTKEFQRKTQSTDYIARWKATEFRFVLLYCGPIVLKKLLPAKLYKHFLLLHVSMRILCSERLVMRYKDKARAYLEIFVQALPHLYGEDAQVINMHNLQHIVDDVESLGCDLSKVNCFPFESFLGRMKSLIRTPNQPLKQYCRRQHEQNHLPRKNVEIPSSFKIVRSVMKNETIFVKSLIFNSSFTITTSTPNNVVLLKDGSVMEINKIYGENKLQESLYIEGNVRKKKTDIFSYPLTSSKIGVWRVPNKQSLTVAVYPLNSIEQKLVQLNLPLQPEGKLSTYILALLHV